MLICGFTALGILAAESVAYACMWCRDKYLHYLLNRKTILQILFFPDPKLSCRDYFSRRGCRNPRCRLSHDNTSLSQLSSRLNASKKSVDICVFTITSPALANIVIDLHRRGVQVRIITDQEQIDCSGSQVGRFRQEGRIQIATMIMIAVENV